MHDFRRRIETDQNNMLRNANFSDVIEPGPETNSETNVELNANVELNRHAQVKSAPRTCSTLPAMDSRQHEFQGRVLPDQQGKLDCALAAANIAAWEWDAHSGTKLLNGRWIGLLGYGDAAILPGPDGIRGLIHPDDSAMAAAAFSRHIRDESPDYEAEFRLRHRQGHWLWYLDRGRVTERDAAGKPLRAAGALVGIDRQKRLLFEGGELTRRVESLVVELAASVASNVALAAFAKPGHLDCACKNEAQLTARQHVVLDLVATGMTSAKIATHLNISAATVMAHRRDIMRKLELHSVAALTRYALEMKSGKLR
jgi:DNA-binding CsgD family transcriptional regulator/PAS domain-containing protein